MDPKLNASLERILTVYVTYLVVKYGTRIPGFDSSIVPDLVVVIMSIGSVAYGIYKNSKAKLITTVAQMPEVKKIELTQTSASAVLAADTPSNVTVGTTKETPHA